jgi:hypothetical protein
MNRSEEGLEKSSSRTGPKAPPEGLKGDKSGRGQVLVRWEPPGDASRKREAGRGRNADIRKFIIEIVDMVAGSGARPRLLKYII